MKIGIIDADLMDNGTRHPNLALMKISGYYKEKGHDVKLIYNSYMEIYEYDKIYLSKVFSFTEVPTWVLEKDNIEVGGTGFYADGGKNLDYEIEHHKPDYSLYNEYVEEQLKVGRKRTTLEDYMDYSIGFSTRGCFRQCKFCVNKKYEKAFKHSPISEFLDENRPYLYLWDDNFFAYPHWEKILDEIEATGKPFQFRQGLDLRLMTDRKAKRFNNTNYRGDFIFAFDHLEDKDKIVEKIQLWKRYSSKICKLYVLCGFESQDEKDIENAFERIKILMEYGCMPYIMRYEDYKKSKYRSMYIELARWCNQPQFYKKKSFREFCEANQMYKKDQSKNCSSYQAMLDFERDFPEIALKYFDLKFEDENIYKVQYGYGRKYQNKPLCKTCKKNNNCWDYFIKYKGDSLIEQEFIKLYFNKEIDLLCLNYKTSDCITDTRMASEYIKYILLKYNIEDLINILKYSEIMEDITPQNIPQISKFSDVTRTVQILIESEEENMRFNTLGYYLNQNDDPNRKNDLALKKYGENHSKLAALLDLTIINKSGHNSYINISDLGKQFYKLNDEEKYDVLIKLLLRVPIIRNCVLSNFDYNTIANDIKILSKTTQKRRKTNIIEMVNMVKSLLKDQKI